MFARKYYCLLRSSRVDFLRNKIGTISFADESRKTLTYSPNKISSIAPGSEEVKIKTIASQITYEDVRAVKGISPANILTSIAGTTAVGTVEAVGAQVNNISVGDSVFVSSLGTWADTLTASSKNTSKLPNLPAEDAALIPSLVSAWGILNIYASLKSGDVVLQLNGSSPVGVSITEIAKSLGVTVINANPSELNSPEFKAKIKGEVKLAVTSTPGSAAIDLMKHLSKSGTLVFYNGSIIPVASGETLSASATASIFEDKRLCGFDFTAFSTDKQNFSKGLEYVSGLISAKKISLKAKIFKSADYAAALKAVEETGALAIFKD